MKTFSMLSLTFGVALVISSCNNTSGGRATPIDSTNDNGIPPVEYSKGNPDNKTDPTMQTQPADQKARQDNSANSSMNAPTETPAKPSNTDSATTSGSSNGKKANNK